MKIERRYFQVLLVLAASSTASWRHAFAEELKRHEPVTSVNGVCDVVLEAAVRDNPFRAAGDNITLRSPVYILREANGRKRDECRLVGPVISIGKGDKLRIVVKNGLKAKLLPSEQTNLPENYPHGYAVTNLHTHGLHVSPTGNADNIYVEIKPEKEHQFEYQLLPNHPAGTFWYHPHKHGSVALQITGGMAGALIVRGDLDDIDGIKQATEQILVLQQIHGKQDPADPTGMRLVAQPSDIYDKLGNPPTPAAGQPPVPVPTRRVQAAARRAQATAAQNASAAKAAPAVGNCLPPAVQALQNDQE